MPALNVINTNSTLKNFFGSYETIEGNLPKMSRVELLEYLGTFVGDEGDDKADVNNYSPNDTYITLTSAATGIKEADFLKYAMKHYKHDN